MNEMFDRFAYAQAAQPTPAHRGMTPAIGLAFAAGASLAMWSGLVHAIRWATESIF